MQIRYRNHDVDSEPNKYVVRKGKRSFVLRFKMPKASQHSNEEVSEILHLKLLGKSVKEISKLLNLSKSMIYRVLTRKTPYEPKPRSGRQGVLKIFSVIDGYKEWLRVRKCRFAKLLGLPGCKSPRTLFRDEL
ncbi:hypothetical protein AVEN_88796-1 [Araneus ventricosus]|uniref:Transposase IS30-like HTH domain-containing protein n=1 Tax=Araneus ventricosus TaxID=182803 RepID=A0A4Y2U9D6_ARAVE|nr:hypothetical protein AVEN_88796-1 [Araneus ventricosus]